MNADKPTPRPTAKWLGKSVNGYTLVERTAEKKYTSYQWRVRCDGCQTVQAWTTTPSALRAGEIGKHRMLCDNPECPASKRANAGRQSGRNAAYAAAAAGGADTAAIAKQFGVTRSRAGQILRSIVGADDVDARLAAATHADLLAAILKRPYHVRRLIAITLHQPPEPPCPPATPPTTSATASPSSAD